MAEIKFNKETKTFSLNKIIKPSLFTTKELKTFNGTKLVKASLDKLNTIDPDKGWRILNKIKHPDKYHELIGLIIDGEFKNYDDLHRSSYYPNDEVKFAYKVNSFLKYFI